MYSGLNIPVQGKRKTLYNNASNNQLIQAINKQLPEAIEQTKSIAKQFKGKTIDKTILNIFNYLKTIKYTPDTERLQLIRLPSVFIREGGDCKSFALFTAAILANLRIPNALKYAGYDNNKIVSHVYNIVYEKNGYVPIDAVFTNIAGTEKKYTNSKIYDIMRVETIQGFSIKNAVKQVSTAVKKVIPDKVESFVQNKIIEPAKVISLQPSRTAFRALVEMNFRHFASKLNEARYTGREGNIKQTWESLGGNFNDLVKSIDIGKNRKGIFGNNDLSIINSFKNLGGNMDKLLFELNKNKQRVGEAGTAATVATVAAAAAPIIVAVISALKKDGISVPEGAQIIQDNKKLFEDYTGNKIEDTVFSRVPDFTAPFIAEFSKPGGSTAPPPQLPQQYFAPPAQQPYMPPPPAQQPYMPPPPAQQPYVPPKDDGTGIPNAWQQKNNIVQREKKENNYLIPLILLSFGGLFLLKN